MDAIVSPDSTKRAGVTLDREGARLKSEIEEALSHIPNRRQFHLGRREGDQDCIRGALNLTQRLYANEDARDDGSPAFNHIVRTVHRLVVQWGVHDATLAIAMTLHDTIEDHPETLARLGKRTKKDDHGEAVRIVRRFYGHSVGKLVNLVSKRKSPEGASAETKIALYVSYAQPVARRPEGILLKGSDVCDNVFNPRPGNGGLYSMKKYNAVLPILISQAEQQRKRITARWGESVYNNLIRDLRAAKQCAEDFLKQQAPG